MRPGVVVNGLNRLIAAVLVLGLATSNAAAAYPEKPIRFVVPYAPGGGTDIVARAVAQKLQENLGQPVIVDNRPGGSEIVGTSALVTAAPDGYTIGLISNSLPINASLFPKLPYDSVRDVVPVTMLVNVPLVLVVHPSVPVSSVNELVALAKRKPGALNYASLGSGSPHALAMEWLKYLAGIDVVAVPYKGVAPALTATAVGETQLMFAGLTAGLAQVKAGKLKALAVSPAKGVAAVPSLPAIARDVPEFDLTTWYGVAVPAGTPPAIVAKLRGEIVKALDSPDLRARFAGLGVDTAPMSQEAFAELIRAEAKMWARIIRAAGAKPE